MTTLESRLQILEERLQLAEQEIFLIKNRNSSVSLDKAWETSRTRTAIIAALTYVTAALVFRLLGITNFLSNAIIPTGGYYLSTLSLPLARRLWQQLR